MAHRKKPTREGTGSSARYAEAMKTWKAEHNNSGSNRNKLTQKDKDGIKREKETNTYLKNKPKGGYTAKNAGEDKGVQGKKFVPKSKKVNKKVVEKDKDPNAAYKPKAGTAASRIQKKLIKGGHDQEDLNFKARRHADWKKARKAGTLGDWEKKYHPDRTPEYSNKNKKSSSKNGSSKNGSNRETLKATQGNPMPSNPAFRGAGNNKQFKKKKGLGHDLFKKMFD